MVDLSPSEIARLFCHIADRAADHVSDQLLDPFPMDPNDPIDLQRASKQISGFLGLSHITFVVASVRQGRNAAGSVELGGSPATTYVEIADALKSIPLAVAATLCHEIAHKFAEVHKVYFGPVGETAKHNEIVTDLVAVYAGCGKVMLNGCEYSRSHSSTEGSTMEEGKIGYLSSNTIARAHVLASSMRGIDWRLATRGLVSAAATRMKRARRDMGWMASPDSVRRMCIRWRDTLRDDVSLLERETASTDRLVDVLEKTWVQIIRSEIVAGHRKAEVEFRAALNVPGAEAEDSQLAFLRRVPWLLEVERLHKAILAVRHTISLRGRQVCDALNRLVREGAVSGNLPTDGSVYRRCWNDGAILRLPVDRGLVRATCPCCKKSMMIDTTNPATAIPKRPLLRRAIAALVRVIGRRSRGGGQRVTT